MKILGFYFFFYLFLGAIFVAFVAGFNGTCPDDKPFLHGRALQTPGLAYLPNLDYSNYSDWITTHHRDIDPSTAFVYKSGPEEYKKYADKAQKFLDTTDVDYSHLGACKDYPYGFDENKPCLFFKLNKIIGWEPMGVFGGDIISVFEKGTPQTLSQEAFCDGKAQWCKDNKADKIANFIKDIDMTTLDMSSTKPIIRCMQYSDSKTVPLEYFPASGQLNWTVPFNGCSVESCEEPYVNPVVAVQFDLREAKNVPHRFYCFAFDRNIELDYKKMSSGVIAFYLKLNS